MTENLIYETGGLVIQKKYGEAFKSLRENKNITITSISDEFVSKSMISKFENNQSNISAYKLFHLLNKIQVKSSEYELALNDYYPDGFQMLLSDATSYFLEKNAHMLRILSENELNIFKENKNKMNYLNHLMLEVMVSMVEDCDLPSDKDFSQIGAYLFVCDNWGYYELVLYGNAMGRMPIDQVLIFSRNLPSKTLLMSDATSLFPIYINLITNTISLCIEHNLSVEAKYFLKALSNLDIDETMLFERMLYKYYEGLYMIKFEENSRSGHEAIKNVLFLLQSLQCTKLYDIFLQEYEKYTV